eukprot:6473105-Amphidinium_carterae.1
MMTACKANHDHTLRYVVSVENVAREGRSCPEVPRKFRRLSLKLGVAVERITKRSDLGVNLQLPENRNKRMGRHCQGSSLTTCC